jgi:hypothetical protein
MLLYYFHCKEVVILFNESLENISKFNFLDWGKKNRNYMLIRIPMPLSY